MARSEGGGRRWLAYGCMGCAGLVGVVLLIAAVVTASAWRSVQSEQVEQRTLSQEVPAGPAPPGPEETPGTPAVDGQPGKVVLELSEGKFHIEPGEPGEPLRVEATYDTASYTLQEQYEPRDDGWTYTVKFRRTGGGGMLRGLLRELMGASAAEVHVFLPVDTLLDLDLDLKRGESKVDLGGLWLDSAAVELNMGGLELDFGEPLRAPMRELAIEGSMGGLEASSIGNASPRRLAVEFSMGGLALDLHGAWVVDSDISIDTSMGGGLVRLPDDVNVVGIEPTKFRPRSDSETPRPTLTFSVSQSRGELQFR